MCRNIRPPAVVVSIGSVNEAKPAPRALIWPSKARRSESERASRSSFHTKSTSPLLSPSIARRNCLRSIVPPLALSAYTRRAPFFFSAPIWPRKLLSSPFEIRA